LRKEFPSLTDERLADKLVAAIEAVFAQP
jgi:hypothetical protein